MKSRPSKPQASPSRDDLLDAEAPREGSPGRPPTRHRLALARFSSELAKAIGPHLGILRHTELPVRQVLEDALVAGLGSPWLLGELAAALEELDAPLDNTTILRGDLSRISLAEIVQLCQLRRQSGILRVSSGERACIAALREGEVDLVFASGTGGAFRLGRYLRRLDLVSEVDLAHALEASAGRTPLGEWLVKAGAVQEADLQRALRQQSGELFYELIGWSEGHFTLSAETPWPEAERAHLGLGLGELLLEGCRRLDERSLLEAAIALDRPLVLVPETLATVAEKLGPIERSVLDGIDGVRTATSLRDTTLHAPFEILSAIYRLMKANVVRYAT